MKGRFIKRFIIKEKGVLECIRASHVHNFKKPFLTTEVAQHDTPVCYCHVCFSNLSENMPGKLSSHVAKFT